MAAYQPFFSMNDHKFLCKNCAENTSGSVLLNALFPPVIHSESLAFLQRIAFTHDNSNIWKHESTSTQLTRQGNGLSFGFEGCTLLGTRSSFWQCSLVFLPILGDRNICIMLDSLRDFPCSLTTCWITASPSCCPAGCIAPLTNASRYEAVP